MAYNEYNNDTLNKKKKRMKIKPKMILGIVFGSLGLFILSFLLSYMLMTHSTMPVGSSDLSQENEDLKERIEFLEKRLSKYETVDDFNSEDVPSKYTGGTITPGSGQPLSSEAVEDKAEVKSEDKTDSSKDTNKETNKATNKVTNKESNKSEVKEDSAFDGVVPKDDPVNTGISDAPVELN
ncbi:MAG: hypothetical protein PHE51_00075 [Eubacteriales bacterium]|nr:hypothetical protein [Eubacteriales bacterium]